VAQKVAIIIGAGPAGLTAAYEFLDRTDVKPVVLEMTGEIGGLARTAVYKGNRMDIGGHRFFSKSDRVMAWWQNILPLQGAPARDDRLLGRKVPVADKAVRRPLGASVTTEAQAPDPDREDAVMLVRGRRSQILALLLRHRILVLVQGRQTRQVDQIEEPHRSLVLEPAKGPAAGVQFSPLALAGEGRLRLHRIAS